MTYEKIFSDIQKNFKKAKISDFTREFAFQFNITGEGEGIFYTAYKNGVLSVEPYDYKDRDVIFTADAKTLTAIAAGKLEPIDAINSGKLAVDGNQELAKELMLLINHEKKAETKTVPEKSEAKPAEKAAMKEKKAEQTEAKPAVPTETETPAKPEETPDAAAREPDKVPEKESIPTTAAPKAPAKTNARPKPKKGRKK